MDFDKYVDYMNENIKGGELVSVGNLQLTNKEIQVLDNFEIPYSNCNTLKELIFLIEDAINYYEDNEDLQDVSYSISERDYYINTKK